MPVGPLVEPCPINGGRVVHCTEQFMAGGPAICPVCYEKLVREQVEIR